MRRPVYWLSAAAVLAACGRPPDSTGAPDAGARPPIDAPLGGHYLPGGDAVGFRVRSRAATRIDVEIHAEPYMAGPPARYSLAREPGADVWSIAVPTRELPETIYYGYRAWGPNWPFDAAWVPGSEAGFVADVDDDGNRFNPNKLLLDPYARELSHDPINLANHDYRWYLTGQEDRTRDSGPVAPKGIVLRDESVDPGPPQHRPLRDDIIYEVHLRGLTMSDPDAACPGTYRAAGARAGYLAELGVTAIELLPLHETPNDQNDIAEGSGGDNYWGYSSLSFFAPDRRYACDRSPGGPTRELREMVRAFHEHGIKVYVDVVYNHTAEGGVGSDGARTALLSWRGLDNAAYYELADDPSRYHDSTAIGANVNAADPIVRDMVIDSLRYWSDELGVDGFRFDLATVLGNGCERGCFRWDPDDSNGVLARAVAELPVRPPDGGPGVDLIAEPWAIEGGTYRLGEFPAGWSQWNDRYRSLVRADQNELDRTPVTPGWLAARLAGSSELFADEGGPHHSINYLVSHDGFTLRDLYSCNEKDNRQPWPYGPSDGGDDHNQSWDQTGDPVRQRQAARTGLALLMMSSGVPMITGGDEMYRTQFCNNNPYNLDSAAIWLDWSNLDAFESFHVFARRLMQFRHAHPALRRSAYDGSPTWHRADGTETTGAYMDDAGAQFLGMRVFRNDTDDPAASIYVAYNGGTATVRAALPPNTSGAAWYRAGDTAAWMEAYGNFDPAGEEYRMTGTIYDVAPRSVVVFLER